MASGQHYFPPAILPEVREFRDAKPRTNTTRGGRGARHPKTTLPHCPPGTPAAVVLLGGRPQAPARSTPHCKYVTQAATWIRSFQESKVHPPPPGGSVVGLAEKSKVQPPLPEGRLDIRKSLRSPSDATCGHGNAMQLRQHSHLKLQLSCIKAS